VSDLKGESYRGVHAVRESTGARREGGARQLWSAAANGVRRRFGLCERRAMKQSAVAASLCRRTP